MPWKANVYEMPQKSMSDPNIQKKRQKKTRKLLTNKFIELLKQCVWKVAPITHDQILREK